MPLRVLIVTNLFADPFNASRATFNQQQFARLELVTREDKTTFLRDSYTFERSAFAYGERSRDQDVPKSGTGKILWRELQERELERP